MYGGRRRSEAHGFWVVEADISISDAFSKASRSSSAEAREDLSAATHDREATEFTTNVELGR